VKSGTPKFGTPQAGVPKPSTPQAGVPKPSTPQAGVPKPSTPKTGTLFCDGGSRGNPGPAAAAAILYAADGRELDQGRAFLGHATNNVAEYRGVLLGLELVRAHGLETLVIKLDSELIVRQLSGVYRVKDAGLKPLWQACRHELSRLRRWEACHVPRAENQAADRLVNLALDEQTG
jgi:ribonuclease HI